MNTPLLRLFLIILLFASCNKKKECPPTNIYANELPGAWTDARARTTTMFAGTRYDFLFIQDSFNMVLSHWSDMISMDSCNTHDYQEYVAGTYAFTSQNNVLEVSGVYTDSVFRKINAGCYNIGQFKRYYKVVKRCDTLIFDEVDNLAPNFVIRLIRKQ